MGGRSGIEDERQEEKVRNVVVNVGGWAGEREGWREMG